MEQIRNKEYGGERPLFATHDLQLEDVTIHAGESALKECSNIIAINCRFEGKYPFWHTNGFIVKTVSLQKAPVPRYGTPKVCKWQIPW